MRVRGCKDRAAAVTGGTGRAKCLAHRATMLGPVCIPIIMARGYSGLVQVQVHSRG